MFERRVETYPGGLSINEEKETVAGNTGASVVLDKLIYGVKFTQPHKVLAHLVLKNLEVLNFLTISRQKQIGKTAV